MSKPDPSPSASANSGQAALSEADVRDYLGANEDFFERHPDLLQRLRIPHESGAADSLLEKQISVARERNREIRQRLNSLAESARHNDRLFECTRALVLQLLEARGPQELAAAFHRSMKEDFATEHACMILFEDEGATAGQCRVEPLERAQTEIGALLKSGRPICGVLRQAESAYLFPGASGTGSAAVAPLGEAGALGVIAVGSDDPGRYTSDMGTLFLEHIADVLVRLLAEPGDREAR